MGKRGIHVDDGLRRDVVAAVQAVEKGSAAEVVVTVVPRSAAHWDVSLAAALAVVFLIQAVAVVFFQESSALAVALESGLVGLLVIGLVRSLAPLERLLLPGRVAARRVEAGAESAFCRQGIFRTRAHTGVLLYLSQLERRAVLLPDDGVAQTLPAEALAALHAQAAALFAQPDPRAALFSLLDYLRRVGARHLPASADDVNELPDGMVTG